MRHDSALSSARCKHQIKFPQGNVAARWNRKGWRFLDQSLFLYSELFGQ